MNQQRLKIIASQVKSLLGDPLTKAERLDLQQMAGILHRMEKRDNQHHPKFKPPTGLYQARAELWAWRKLHKESLSQLPGEFFDCLDRAEDLLTEKLVEQEK